MEDSRVLDILEDILEHLFQNLHNIQKNLQFWQSRAEVSRSILHVIEWFHQEWSNYLSYPFFLFVTLNWIFKFFICSNSEISGVKCSKSILYDFWERTTCIFQWTSSVYTWMCCSGFFFATSIPICICSHIWEDKYLN